jgi:molybdopterin synthase catalytic subunit
MSSSGVPAHLDPSSFPQSVHIPASNIHILLTYAPLSPSTHLSHVRSPAAGANVLFAGTTRNTFDDRPVARLSYTCYAPLALRTLTSIAERAVSAHGLLGVSIAHRLGEVPVEEESIVIAVSAGHRGTGWRAAEQVLEECVEIWKREEFEGEDPEVTGEWRANKERDAEGMPAPI